MACVWKFRLALFLLVGSLVVVAAQEDKGRPSTESSATLVIFNNQDPDSRSLAEYYGKQRGIPPRQIIGLDCPLQEEISRLQYQTTMEKPLRQIFESEAWWTVQTNADGQSSVSANQIRFVALIRGIPLKIKTTIPPPVPNEPVPPRPNGGDPIDSRDEASVDSEIALLGAFRSDHFGIINNPFFRRFSTISDASINPGLMLVCRLDAPTPETVRKMIDQSLLAEKQGLYGWAYIDRRSIIDAGYRQGDDWLANVATDCWNKGIPVILDNRPEVLPRGFPVTEAALYYGWYAGKAPGTAMGSPQFQPGAVAVHIHSYSASTLRNPQSKWCAPLLTSGAAATLGNVYEPYLALTSNLDIFNGRLLEGFNLAESGYMSMPVLSWMGVIIGDPLYRPFPLAGASRWRHTTSPERRPWSILGKKLRSASGAAPIQILDLEHLARQSRSGRDYEALGMLQNLHGRAREAIASLAKAGKFYEKPEETFRTVIERIEILQSLGDKKRALRLIDDAAKENEIPGITSSNSQSKLLLDLRHEIDPPPKPKATPNKPSTSAAPRQAPR